MFEPTEEQKLAINKEGTNIIVSAGAGSGKTAVLTKRVSRKLKEGVKINELLILTFTNKAAHEMKERIRKAIISDETLLDNLPLLDSSYITTFDSFSLSIVKKYNYLLNVSKSIKVIESSVIALKYKELLEEVFDELYDEKNPDFFRLLTDLTAKDDQDIKDLILSINRRLDLKYYKREYLDSYLDNNYNDEYINNLVNDYNKLIKDKINKVNDYLTEFSYYVDPDYFIPFKDKIEPLLNSNSYDEYKENIKYDFKPIPKGTDEEGKKLKEKIVKELKDNIDKKYLRFNSTDEIIDTYKSTYQYVKIIIEIINRLDSKINKYKEEKNSYEFGDIAKLAIKVVKENSIVRDELKYFFKEIMIDEYQDTSDLQEEFISMIANNNVYMVGDIKQSIYGFRNANPYLFKSKYDDYSKDNGGFKIDLTNNFRSRKEVVNSINLIFSNIMTNKYGGASYKEEHKMIPGNHSYDEKGSTNQDYNIELLNYSMEESNYSKEEIEIFTIANDIKDKIKNKYQIFDKELRDARYSDFVILVDRSTYFDLFKKIFEYLEIPLTKYSNTNIIEEVEILLVKNIIKLILSYKDNSYDTEFKYALTSVLRSYLFSYTDEDIFKMFKDDNFLDNKAMDIVKEIDSIDSISLNEIIKIIIDKFNFYNNIILVGDVDDRLLRLDEIEKLFNSLSTLDYDLYDTYNYLDEISSSEEGIKIKDSRGEGNTVKIMTIHESKGLEYPVCYFPFLWKEYNEMELNESILYNKKYGIITPYYKEGIGKTFTKDLLINNYKEEEISEKIRLLYVALTRPKEKIILITNFDKSKDDISDTVSFMETISLLKEELKGFIKEIDIDKLGITSDYNMIKKTNYKDSISKTNNKVVIKTYEKIIKETSYKKASKEIHKLITKEEKDKMKFGTDVHEAFEYIDFKNPNYDIIDSKYKDNIKYLIDSIDIDKVINIYKEYEFIYIKDDIKHHGIIDLLLEYPDEYKIIDYKLKNIDDSEYINQLNEYKTYIESKTNKKVETYLYSIINKELKEISVK